MIQSRWSIIAALSALAAALIAAEPAAAQLRIVSYNTATAQNPGTQTARPEISLVLEAIGLQNFAGIARPIDVLLLQEQYTTQISTQSFVNVLNDLYDPINRTMYARGSLNGATSDSLRRAGAPAIVYNTHTVQLVDAADDHPTFPGEKAFGSVGTSTSQQPRSALRYKLRPVGYDAAADFYAYNNHYKSDTGVENNARRLVEAQAVRNDSNSLGEGAHIIFAGDFNIQSTSQEMYQHLLSDGPGRARDPLNLNNEFQSWSSSGAYRFMHTQSPASVSQFSGQTLGGVDDRFDFQLVSDEMLDNEGMSLIPGTYRPFGNNNTHVCCNSPITTGTGASPDVLNALMRASDHLPVVADYQLPAKMGVEVASIPLSVTLGASITIDMTVANVAPASVANGADELDYTLDLTGALSLIGVNQGIDAALGGGQLHQFTLDTASPGMKNGLITVIATSQQAANALFTMPVSYLVVGDFLEADFDGDGIVDGGDLSTWAENFGLESGAMKDQGDANGDAVIDGADLLVWQQQLGALPPTSAVQAAVPEPGAAALCGVLLLFGGRRRMHERALRSSRRRGEIQRTGLNLA